jgi:lipopolysaccharide transport system permease protein
VFAGLLPWQLFAFALSSSANSLITNERLMTKAYFPRVLLPISAVLSGLLDFGLSFLVLLLMMVYNGLAPSAAVAALPVFVLFATTAAIAVGIGLSALNVRFRDVRHVLPFLTQFGLLATPVAYPTGVIAEPWRTIYRLNPMAGIVEGFRWALVGGTEPSGAMLCVSGAIVLVTLALSLAFFLRVESTLADVV